MIQRCKGFTLDGRPCDIKKLVPGEDYCQFHSKSELASAQRAVLRVRSRPHVKRRLENGVSEDEDEAIVHVPAEVMARQADIPFDNPRDVVALMRTTINELRRGEVSEDRAKVLAVLASVGLKAMVSGEMDERMSTAERQLEVIRGLAPEQLLQIALDGRRKIHDMRENQQ